MYVQISSGTKFQLELTILIFLTKFAQKGYFLIEHGKITFVCVPMVVTYYIKLFRTGGERHNIILMSLRLLVVETLKIIISFPSFRLRKLLWKKMLEKCIFMLHGFWMIQKTRINSKLSHSKFFLLFSNRNN